MPVEIICAGCGSVFRLKPSRAATRNQQYCTRECRKAHIARRRTRTCEYCGESFVAEYASAGKFCSLTCYHAHQRSLPQEERSAQIANAQAAVRGMKRSHADLCKRARTKQDRAQLSGDELLIYKAMVSEGLHPVPLLAVDKFNIDFGFPDTKLAVEYHGGNWHSSPSKREQDARKREYLESQGWRVMAFPRLRTGNRQGSRSIRLNDLIEAVQLATSPTHGDTASTQFG